MSLDPEVRRGGNLPFGMVAAQWMCDPRYTTNCRTLYSILVTYADTQQRHTGKGKPYRRELAAQLGVSLTTLDRTLLEMEVAGMVTIEERPDPDNPLNHDANVYHLHDAPLMWQGNGAWADPLGPRVKAADVAKQVVEQRRTEKREKGMFRKGGVPKGVSSKAVRAARQAAEEGTEGEGGRSTSAATPGSTGAARVAAPVLPNIQSPVQTPSLDPDAPSARSAPDARSASTSGSKGSSSSGFAASGKKKSDPLTPSQRQQVQAVRSLLPADLNSALPDRTPRNLSDAILDALATGTPGSRTPEQLVTFRVGKRWDGYWAAKFYAGELVDGKGRPRVVGPLEAMLERKQECGSARCDDRTDVDTAEACRSCEERKADKRADRAAAATVPEQQAPKHDVPAGMAPAPAPACVLPAARTRVDAPDDISVAAEEVVDASLAREAAREALKNRPYARR